MVYFQQRCVFAVNTEGSLSVRWGLRVAGEIVGEICRSLALDTGASEVAEAPIQPLPVALHV